MSYQDKPQEGKIYSLTGLGNSIANGNTWAESEVITYKVGQKVKIDFGHKLKVGTVVEDNGGKYVSVKQDNFKSEVFNRNQLELINQ